MDASELKTQVRNGKALIVLEVRGGDDFIGPLGHIPGTLNMPLGDIPRRLSEINAALNSSVILL